MFDAFIYARAFRYGMFGITGQGDIWRVWFVNDYPMIQKLTGDENEYAGIIRLLKAEKDLYR